METGSTRKRRTTKWEETDVYGSSGRWGRRYLCYVQKAGAIKSIKKRTHRRERREGKDEVRTWLDTEP